MTEQEDSLRGNLPDFFATLAQEKKLAMAKAELYPHLQKIVDAMLEVKGVSYSTADKFSNDRAVLWAWVIAQISTH